MIIGTLKTIRRPGRCGTVLLLALALVTSADVVADESLARHVPADTRLFVELHAADDLLSLLTEPQAWLTVAEFAGQPAREEESRLWALRVRQTLRMSPAEAIHRLFSQRVAFVGEGLRRSQDAVVLCRPASAPRQLLTGWDAQPLPFASRASVYRLPNDVSVALHEDLLFFGNRLSPVMFPRVLKLLETADAPRLADDPVYQGLLRRVPKNADGILFARFGTPTTAPTSAPSSAPSVQRALPGPLAGSSNILLALHRKDHFLHFSAVGDGQPRDRDTDGDVSALIGKLPENTLMAWADHVDYANLAGVADALPERNFLRVTYRIQKQSGNVARLTEALNSAMCITVGAVRSAAADDAVPAIPAAAILLQARDANKAVGEWREFVHSLLMIYKLLAVRMVPTPRALEVEQLTLGGVAVERIDLSALYALLPPDQPPLIDLHLCWALDGDTLILATHSEWLRQVLEARHGRTAPLAAVLGRTPQPPSAKSDRVLFAQTGLIADLGRDWLRYLERIAPAVLDERWWRALQPGGGRVRLGIQVQSDAVGRRLVVKSITAGLPADNVLKTGDVIVGCNGRRFATSQPVQEMSSGLDNRPNARWIDVLVERDGGLPQRHRVVLPFVNPVQTLRHIVAVGRVFRRVVYSDGSPEIAGPRGFLTLELPGPAKTALKPPVVASPQDPVPK